MSLGLKRVENLHRICFTAGFAGGAEVGTGRFSGRQNFPLAILSTVDSGISAQARNSTADWNLWGQSKMKFINAVQNSAYMYMHKI